MRFLLDQNQSPLLCGLLAGAGHDAVHVGDVGLASATDAEIMEVAVAERRVVVSADTDFGELLARSNAAEPSVILLRRHTGRRAQATADLLVANLDAVAKDLEAGAVVVFDEARIRVRSLPFQG